MTQYAKGARLERELKQIKEARGAVCFRSAGSHGLADLICFYDNRIEVIQCKTRKPSNIELIDLHHFPRAQGVKVLWAIRKNRRKWQEIEV